MITDRELSTAAEYVEWLARLVYDQKLPATLRVRVAAACHAIAQDHHHSIVLLLKEKRYAAAFALARPAFESYLRGEWLAHCATDRQVQEFSADRDPPPLNALLSALEGLPSYASGELTSIKRKHWDALCSFTHTGGLHVQRWLTETAIEPSYTVEEVRGALQFAEFVGAMSVLGTATLANNMDISLRVLERVKVRTNAA